MVRRTLLFVLALVLALFGTGLVYAYANSADDRAMAGQKPVQTLVAVARVPAEMPAATADAEGLFEVKTLPRRAVPPGAVKDVEDLRTRVAAADILPGEVILAGKFIDPTVTGALTIPEGMLAVSVELTDPGRVAGFVGPGSDVAIFDTFDRPKPGGAAGEVEQETRLLLPRVRVLAAGPTSAHGVASSGVTTEGEDKPVATSVLTVAVDQAGAEKLVHATQTGTVSFGLLTAQSVTGDSAGVNNTSLFN